MPPKSLTLVLPAYNEAERIGPALDELFGYLRRRGETARDGAPGAAALPERIEVLVVDDGSTDGTAELVRARPEATSSDAAGSPSSRCCRCRTAARARPSAPGCSRRRPTSSSSPTPTWRRRPTDPAARRRARDARRRARQPDPAGRLGHAQEPALVSADAGQGVPPARLGLGRRPGPGHPVRLQGLHAGRPPRTCSRASRSRASCSTSS